MQVLPTRRSLILGSALIILLAGSAGAVWMLRDPPSDLDLSLEKATEAGLFVVGIAPAEGPATVGPLHAWVVTIHAADGATVDDARIGVDGGMPQHGHGLPTAPTVTQVLGDGRYLVEGMRFNMGGWWELELAVEAPQGVDAVTFNLVL